jgi:anion-transporting  ArsA/GET3 family ATPase
VLVAVLEGHSGLGPFFGLDGLGYEEVVLDTGPLHLPGQIRARRIGADDALADYLDRAGLGPLTNRLSRSRAMEVMATAAPGIRDLLALGKIRQIEQRGEVDLIVVDAPAAGHAMTFLTAPAGLAGSASSGPVREQADLVLEMFADDRRCQVALVTLPEETPVAETVEAAFALEEVVGIKLAPVVVNGVWPTVEGLAEAVDAAGPATSADRAVEAGRYRLARMDDQRREIGRLARELPLPQVHLPYLFQAELDLTDLAILAEVLAGRDPEVAP